MHAGRLLGSGERCGPEGAVCGEATRTISLWSRPFLPDFSTSEAGSAAEYTEDRFLLSLLRRDDHAFGEADASESSVHALLARRRPHPQILRARPRHASSRAMEEVLGRSSRRRLADSNKKEDGVEVA
jgi:hypothetical protein